MQYKNKIEFIKAEFGNYYVDRNAEYGPLVGMKYAGAHTHASNCMYTLTKMLKPKRALEIGSYHFQSSNAIAKAMDENGFGRCDTLEIAVGGYDHRSECKPNNNRVHPYYWIPWISSYDNWKNNPSNVVHPEFLNMTNEQIFEANCKIIEDILAEEEPNLYSFIFVDGDHSLKGASYDFEIACKYSTSDMVIAIDNIWDQRLIEVRNFFDSVAQNPNFETWNFEEWNDLHYNDDNVMDCGLIIKKNTN